MQRTYRAVCFDLDGTLLPQELDEFLGNYYKALALSMAKQGVALETFKNALNEGIKAMIGHEPGVTNEKVYWDVFMRTIQETTDDSGYSLDHWTHLFDNFYDNEFGAIGKDVVPDAAMVQAVKTLEEKGYPLLLTTMPLFPPRAVQWRLEWAGLSADSFLRITTYDNSTSTKPNLEYYAENLAAMGIDGADVLMVGNNTVEDYAFTKLGADIYLVTDHLLDPVGFDLSQARHGSSQEFLAWVQELPACNNPIQQVERGIVDAQKTESALRQNSAK